MKCANPNREVLIMAAKYSRREFLHTGAASVSAAMLAPGTALSTSPSAAGANDRIQFGVIGVGNMGTHHVKSLVERGDKDNIRVVAVSDVYQKRVTRARSICQG